MYPEDPFRYGSVCDISLPRFATGVALEQYTEKKWPLIRRPPKRTLFLHYEDSMVHIDAMTGSKSCQDAEMLYFTLGKSPVLLQMIKLCRE